MSVRQLGQLAHSTGPYGKHVFIDIFRMLRQKAIFLKLPPSRFLVRFYCTKPLFDWRSVASENRRSKKTLTLKFPKVNKKKWPFKQFFPDSPLDTHSYSP